MPPLISGKVTVQNAWSGRIPWIIAAPSSSSGTSSMKLRIIQMLNGKVKAV